ncbi:polysaccharide biosynthesis protein [Longimonas halophila]|uniref:polysaccharide biosynthesis protein n=1 Tax=Longimonas halophila TaxID=1469170 RepID=UPI0011448444|nr:polysaccharide biosynthesis protein [Longimonas halophila]
MPTDRLDFGLHRLPDLPRRAGIVVWLFLDTTLVALSLWGAAILMSQPVPGVTLLQSPAAVTLGAMLLSLWATGAYQVLARDIHLHRFIRMGGGMVGAVLVATALAYFWDPTQMLPRGVLALHTLMATGGVLGSRALARLAWEHRHTPAPPTPHPAPMTLYDVVDREPPVINTQELRNALADRTVLVTGAGGSIGSELMAQLAHLHPFRLVGVDMSEYNLYRLRHTLDAPTLPENALDLRLADVRTPETMHRIFRQTTPDVVIHTAAYKHVPMMERHPAEAFGNNTQATMQLLRLCEEHQTGQFLFVSTDKAVQPTSVLGATKRLAEWYVRAAQSPVSRSIVRFGNVFGSRGSVVPRFERCLAAGKPIPVTHPDMERYFMSATEACSLIMHTLLLDSHPVYLFRMGEPVRIQDLAEQLVRRWYPNQPTDAMIEHTGRRPGEKMTEALAMPGEATSDTAHPSILGVEGAMPYSRAELDMHIQHVEEQCRHPDASASQLRRLIMNTPSAPPSVPTRS